MRIILLIIIFQSLNLYGQQSKVSVCELVYDKILKISPVRGWTIVKNDSTIKCTMVDTLCFMPGCCIQLGETCDLKKKDSVIMTIRFEENWANERIKKQRRKNLEIINILSDELTKEMKKKRGWYKVDMIKFKTYKYTTLMANKRYSSAHKINLEDVVRLPDTTIANVGVFVDLSFDYNWLWIYQVAPQKKLLSQLEYISYNVLEKKKLVTGRFEYE